MKVYWCGAREACFTVQVTFVSAELLAMKMRLDLQVDWVRLDVNCTFMLTLE